MSKVAFLFPGQGTQYVGMGKDLYENNKEAREIFDNIFAELDLDLKNTMFEGPEEKLKETKYTQPALVTFSLVLTELLKRTGVDCDYTAGHSLGEYAALYASGVLSIEETVKLAARRGEIMDVIAKSVDGKMAAIIGLEAEKIVEICQSVDGIAEAVNFNEPKQTVIAGDAKGIDEACKELSEAGARRVVPLVVAGPFHSSLMKEAGEKLKEEFSKFDFKKAEKEILANTSAKLISEVEDIQEELYKQAFGPVRWVETIESLKQSGVTKFYEVGAGKVLKGLLRKIDRSLELVNIEKQEDLENK